MRKFDRLQLQDQSLGVSLSADIRHLAQNIGTVLKSHAQLQDKTQCIVNNISMLESLTPEVERRQSILNSLRYDMMQARKAAIADTFANTYKWILEPQDPTKSTPSGTSLANWLQSGDDIYWVSGKAGSGKSTLMNFICEQPRTRELLKSWAGSEALVTANHFFWIAGPPVQKSPIGLLRALCFDVLRQCPDIIADVCKERWGSSQDDERGWNLRDLMAIIERITQVHLQTQKSQCRFCFFIDGLDEFEGDHGELVQTLRQMASSPCIKICASSRPWNAFKNTLGVDKSRMLTLQDLTHDDITEYVRGKLEANEHFVRLARREEGAKELVSEITDKALGVFLWVFLVIRELSKGLANGDTLYELHSRLKQIPPDLEDYFSRMFKTIDSFYEVKTARTFLICLRVRSTLVLLAFAEIEEHDALAAQIRDKPVLEWDEVYEMHARLMARINARCQDLVEVTVHNHSTSSTTYTVDFLHRTVRDFLRTRNIVDELERRAGAGYSPLPDLCRMRLLTVRRIKFVQEALLNADSLKNDLSTLFLHAYDLERESGNASTSLLNDLYLWLLDSDEGRKHFCGDGWTQAVFGKTLSRTSFLSACWRNGLWLYVLQNLDCTPTVFRHLPHVTPIDVLRNEWPSNDIPDPAIFDSVLKGFDAMQITEGWQKLLGSVLVSSDEVEAQGRQYLLALAEALLAADVNCEFAEDDEQTLIEVFGNTETTRLLRVRQIATDKSWLSWRKLWWSSK